MASITKFIKRLQCLIQGHQWRNDNHYPVHGYSDTPYQDSYCLRCGKAGTARCCENVLV